MRISWVSAVFAASAAITNALPSAVSQDEPVFEISQFVSEALKESLETRDVDDFTSMAEKRDLTSTFEGLLNTVNKSDLVFIVLDQIAYNPSRIEKLANKTSQLLGGIDLGSISNITSGLDLKLDINATAIYNEVMDSGVVSSLLDGILLDTSYRPVVAGIVSRVLEGNKNLINYLMKNVFRSSKRDQILSKRANSGTLEIFVGNIISTVLSSQLVGDAASDFLTALNETQFLTYTVKRFLADEGYQNMTAQLVLDLVNSGGITLNAQAINITSIANKALSKPQVLVSIVSNLLSGSVSLPALGKYNSAVSSILKEVENEGVFADLNQYVFSETHSVSTPILPTAQIVVPRTTTAVTTTTSRNSTRSSTSTRRASSSSPNLIVFSDYSQQSAYYASLATASSNTRSVRTTTTGRTSSITDPSVAESSAEVASILSVLQGMDSASVSATETETETETAATITGLVYLTTTNIKVTSSSTSTSGVGGLLGLIAGLGADSSSANLARREAASVTDLASGAGASQPMGLVTKALIFAQAILVGGLVVL